MILQLHGLMVGTPINLLWSVIIQYHMQTLEMVKEAKVELSLF